MELNFCFRLILYQQQDTINWQLKYICKSNKIQNFVLDMKRIWVTKVTV
uniref:Uncharacterized protein n=1 Tax=Anguilla anguilla TaxID=7936 RepID=A0A0E9PEH1_ANGAN